LQILATVTDNATSNDTQRSELEKMDNSYDEVNHVRCFNHTLQLSAKALMGPFNPALGNAADINFNSGQGDFDVEYDDDDHEETDRSDLLDISDSEDDDINELDTVDAHSRERMIEDAAAIRTTISKLREISFSVIRSPTIALPAWKRYCVKFALKSRIFPRDVVTRWNSTFDMLDFALEYRAVIDAMTADKALKLRQCELEDEEWLIITDLVDRLRVTTVVYHPLMSLTLLHRYTKTLRSISPEILRVPRWLFPQWMS
jgi:hypothetical protein